MKNIYLAHAGQDGSFACSLSDFLQSGCNVACELAAGDDLLATAEEGLSGDLLILLLSPASCPSRWPRDRWEPILFEATRSAEVELVTVLLGDCPYPPLLARRNFFDATTDSLAAMRKLKRWIWHWERAEAHVIPTISPEFEELYATLSDQPGALEVSGETAQRFVKEASQEFEGVLWVPCYQRTLAQIAGELGSQLDMLLNETAEQNYRKAQNLLSRRRCLLVLDSPAPELAAGLAANGRTSTLVALDPVKIFETPRTLPYARILIAQRRYAEAYELLYELLECEGPDGSEKTARELSWICEQWDRVEEASSLRLHYRLAPVEQLTLF